VDVSDHTSVVIVRSTMDSSIQTFQVPLLHAAAMMFFPIIMGLSTTLCLRSRPSPFSVVSVHEYVELTKWLDRVWLLAILGWVMWALSRGGDGISLVLTAGLVFLALVLVAAHFWFRLFLAREVAAAAVEAGNSGDLTAVSDQGVCIAQRRESDGSLRFPRATVGARLYGAVGFASLGLFTAATMIATGRTPGPSIAQCVLLAGLYISLGVISVDLIEDVWPGFTTRKRLRRASRYYVQIFEEWKNQGVLVGFLIVLLGAPYVYSRGEAPLAVMSFPIWVGSCLCFATFFNQVLFPRGLVSSTLPLPVWVNVYSVKYPLWANFFAIIHLVMAIALLVGISVLGI
jgi:hypothetical protein